MKRMLVLMIALALLLVACAPVLDLDESTTLMQGEASGITWRTFDLNDPAYAESRAWIEAELAREEKEREARQQWWQQDGDYYYIREFRMGEVVVLNRFSHAGYREILMRDAVGDEVVLFASPENYSYVDHLVHPSIIDVLNSRFFLMQSGGSPWAVNHSVFDIYTQREYPIETKTVVYGADGVQLRFLREDTMYWAPFISEMDTGGHGHLFAASIADLPQMTFVDLLANIEHYPMHTHGDRFLCPNERYYVMVCTQNLTLFDLEKQTAFQLDKHDLGIEMGSARRPDDGADWSHAYLERVLLRDNTIYWFSSFTNENLLNMNIAVQITLS